MMILYQFCPVPEECVFSLSLLLSQFSEVRCPEGVLWGIHLKVDTVKFLSYGFEFASNSFRFCTRLPDFVLLFGAVFMMKRKFTGYLLMDLVTKQEAMQTF